jgi:hypothetical protein
VALVIQAAGGGLASSANTVSEQNLVSYNAVHCSIQSIEPMIKGSNIMLAGIVFQLGT